MKLIRKAGRLLQRVSTAFKRAADFRSARKQLLSLPTLPEQEKDLLRAVSLRVHRHDGMYEPGKADEYFSAGLSAIRCIESALNKSAGNHPTKSILDFPCGYGRVLRFLKVRFPEADTTVSELDATALSFCKRVFAVRAAESTADFAKLSLARKFDLIWCGSLATHLSERATMELLRFFRSHLSEHGLCIFTTHGQLAVDRLEKKTKTTS